MDNLIDTLPNPHLFQYLPKKYGDMDEVKRRKALRIAHLTAAGLPRDYYELTGAGQLEARQDVLSSWFDPKQPNILCTDTEAFVKSMYLWVEHYMRPSIWNAGKYFHRDPKHKYQMVRLAMSDPLSPREVAKTVVHAPRGSTKTITYIQQMVPMIAICRPYSNILISEINDTRTREEIQGIRAQIENNEIIDQEFGGKGVLYPRSNRDSEKWTDNRLDFVHLPQCRISGYSIGSSQRGRHPILGIIDDPEDKETIKNPKLRKEFFSWLFSTYLPMFQYGGKVLWIGTIIHRNSCLMIALEGSEVSLNELDEPEETRDARFEDWNRCNIKMIFTNEDGQQESVFPDYITPEDYEEKKRSLGIASASAEYQGDPVAGGQFAFARDPMRHGYMRCQAGEHPGELEDYMLDLKTGITIPWTEFIDSLKIVGATDLADSQDLSADFGAIGVVGVDPHGIKYVLDFFIKRKIADEWVEKTFNMAGEWGASLWAFETGSMQNVVVRMAKRYAASLEERGIKCPSLVPLNNKNINKTQRILAVLRPPMGHEEIRYPYFNEITDANGRVHVPKPNPHRVYLGELLSQIDTFTDEGASGPDDAIDVLHLALRLLGGRKGEIQEEKDANEEEIEKWREAGVTFPDNYIPLECWTEDMWDKRKKDERALALSGYMDVDPYE